MVNCDISMCIQILLWSNCISKGVFCFSWMFTESRSHLCKLKKKNWKLCRRKFQWLLYCQNDLLLGSLSCNHSYSFIENRVSVSYVLWICFLFFPLLQISRKTAAWINGWTNTGKTGCFSHFFFEDYKPVYYVKCTMNFET